MTLFPYGETFRQYRKLANMALGPGVIKKYHHPQERVALQLVTALLDKPAQFRSLFHLSAGRIVIGVIYGFQVESEEDVVSSYISEHLSVSLLSVVHHRDRG
jgi:cytochrome P450